MLRLLFKRTKPVRLGRWNYSHAERKIDLANVDHCGTCELTSENKIKRHFEKKEIIVKQIIQSPFWDRSNIESIYLKKAIEDINKDNKHIKINFDYLFDKEPRYKLSWYNWNL